MEFGFRSQEIYNFNFGVFSKFKFCTPLEPISNNEFIAEACFLKVFIFISFNSRRNYYFLSIKLSISVLDKPGVKISHCVWFRNLLYKNEAESTHKNQLTLVYMETCASGANCLTNSKRFLFIAMWSGLNQVNYSQEISPIIDELQINVMQNDLYILILMDFKFLCY